MERKQMPALNLSEIHRLIDAAGMDTRYHAIADRIVSGQGKNKGCLRAARPEAKAFPTKEKDRYGRPVYDRDFVEGSAAYVWRNVAFAISPLNEHHCMPVLDFCYVPGHGEASRLLAKELDKLVELIVRTVPPRQQHGTIRWGNALGMIGTPQYNEEGAVVYR